jgi:CheY-like chemotaxis protein
MSANPPPSALSLVLLIEDDPQQVNFISLMLRESLGTQHLEIVQDGQEALDLLRRLDAPDESSLERRLPSVPQLIILDLHLPNAHGLKVLQHIKSQPSTKAIPIIVLTASYISRDMKKSYDLGAVSFLRKPIDVETLTRAVEYCLTAARL